MKTGKRNIKEIPDAIKGIHFKLQIPKDERQSKRMRVPLELSRFSHIVPVKVPGENYEIKFKRKNERPKKAKISKGERICIKDYKILYIHSKETNGEEDPQEFEFEFIN